MLSIGLVASASAAATYFLGDAPGCQAGYYLRPDGHVGRWIGGGAIALGLSGGIDARGEHAFRLLLDGRAPRGDRLVEPVMRSDPHSRQSSRRTFNRRLANLSADSQNG